MESVSIRSVQHFLYCPHRWGLIEIERSWAENYFVAKGNLLHKRVHDPDKSYTLRGKKIFTSVSVWNDLPEYDLFGVTDCIEAAETDSPCAAKLLGVNYQLCIVEYKPTKPKSFDYREEDALQVFAQKICVDYVFGGNCKAVIYYGDVKKRVELPFEQHFSLYDAKLKSVLEAIRINLRHGKVPQIGKNQKCSGCSFSDICMPKLKKQGNVHSKISAMLEEIK